MKNISEKMKEMRKNEIEIMKKIINDNKNIRYNKVISKLKVNEPYLSEKRAKELITDLINDGQIIINKDGELSCL